MVKFNIIYEGDLRCKATHGPSGTVIFTDAPTDNHGRGESFSPTDLCAVSLGVCAITTIAIKTLGQDINLTGTNINVEKHMTDAPPRRIKKILVEFNMPGGIQNEKREILRKIAEECPVALSLHPDVEKVFTFNYSD
jgi:putative redox protein